MIDNKIGTTKMASKEDVYIVFSPKLTRAYNQKAVPPLEPERLFVIVFALACIILPIWLAF